MQASKHTNEEARLLALQRYDVLDSPVESDFDDITQLISRICETPISVINLIDRDRQFFKSEIGLGVRETPLDISICAHAILQPDVFVVADTMADKRFVDNPLVTGDPHLRFYAGALLETSDGFPLGTLCVLDYQPRVLDDLQIASLRVLAKQVMTQLELRRALAHEQRIAETLQRALLYKPQKDAIVGIDIQTTYTPAWDEAQVGGDFYDVIPLPGDRVALVVGDVSGKGLAAAAQTARAKFTLRVYLQEGLTPAAALTRLNDHILDAPAAPSDADAAIPFTFVALTVVVLDGATGVGTVSVAGMEPPLLRRDTADGVVLESLESNGAPVGIDHAVTYTDLDFTLDTGDLLVLVTDGITEARRGRKLFGYAGLQRAIAAAPAETDLATIGTDLLDEVRRFTNGNLGDDVCVLLARRV